MIGKITIQMCDYHTRNYIGKEFKSSYRLHKDDEIYYSERKDRFHDTVWTVMLCRTESYDSTKQVLFVIPKGRNSVEALRKKNEDYSKNTEPPEK
jgi:hypothetical protein